MQKSDEPKPNNNTENDNTDECIKLDDGRVLLLARRGATTSSIEECTGSSSSLETTRLEVTKNFSFIVHRPCKSYCSYAVIWITIIATACTFVASWDCNTFHGAESSSSQGARPGYGIWSLEDSGKQCQLWDVLFAPSHLDTPLRMARILSMTAMLASLVATAIMCQVLPRGRMANSMLTLGGLISWIAKSMAKSEHRFNVWLTFFILTYMWMIFFANCILLRKYTSNDLWKLARCLLLICCVGSAGIFAMLASNLCMCETTTIDDHRSADNFSLDRSFNATSLLSNSERQESCDGQCALGPSSSIVIASPLLWLLGWIGASWVSLDESNDTTASISTTHSYKPRQRFATASTVDLSDDDNTIDDDVELGNENDFQPSDLTLPSHSLQILFPCTSVEFDDDSRCHDNSMRNTVPPEACESFDSDDDTDHGDDDSSSHRNKFTPTIANIDKSDMPAAPRMDTSQCSEAASTRSGRRFQYSCWIIISILEIFIVAVLLGSYYQNKRALLAPDTSHNFITEVVCAFDESGVFQTFQNPDQAVQAGYKIAHCGECGECSNPSDIARYVETRKTVAEQSMQCSLAAILGTDEQLEECLERELGFTRSCTICWAENMRNTAKSCLWTCISNVLRGDRKNKNVDNAKDYDLLNQCVFCDEKLSGTEFVQCSGVARRRLGIASEFQRDPMEMCPVVQVDYLSSSWQKGFIPL